MKKCVICESEIKFFPIKIKDNYICKECRNMLPVNIFLKDANEYFLRDKYNKAKARQKEFKTMVRYGNLYIDSVHNMLCYSEKCGKDDTPLMFGDIFRIEELKRVGLFISNVRNIGSNVPRVVCDIKMHIETDEIKTDYVIARSKKCIIEENGDKMDCTAPPEILMVQNVIGQMIDNYYLKTARRLEEIMSMKKIADKYSGDKDWAKGVLFLNPEEEYSKDEIKSQFRKVTKMLHPDTHPELSDEYMKKVNKAYKILQ